MVKEEYVDKNMMNLLLNKGYPFEKVIVQDFRPLWYSKDYNDPTWESCNAYYIPTCSQVLKWLRYVHKLHVDIVLHQDIIDIESEIKISYNFNVSRIDRFCNEGGDCKYYNFYEHACKAAIIYCLTLINN